VEGGDVRRRGRQAGFTLIEVLIALVLVAFGLALAAGLLMETSQMMVDAAAEQAETALPLARARLRIDVQSCRQALPVPDARGELGEIWLLGHPSGTVRYRKVGREVVREVAGAGGAWSGGTVVLRNVEEWNLIPTPGAELLALEIRVLRRAVRRTPLPTMPAVGAPGMDEKVETLVVAPRAGGLRLGW
jgi:prepilin-type N-terminal cleavage/methylation domain-containing protein